MKPTCRYKLDSMCDDEWSNGYSYTDDALGVFMNMSRIIIDRNESDTNISSPAKRIKLCEDPDSYNKLISVHPGGQFNITLKAISQFGSPVSANIFIDNSYTLGSKYEVSPLSQSIDASCTTVYFRLYSSVEDQPVRLGLFPENPCQSLVKDLEIVIYTEHCPSGFEIPKNFDRCVCNKKIKNFVQNCYIDEASFERARNNFGFHRQWLS